MLHIIAQYKQLFMSLISYFEGPDLAAGLAEGKTESEKKDFIKEKKDDIINYLNSTDGGTFKTEDRLNGKLGGEDFGWKDKDKETINKLLSTIGFEKQISLFSSVSIEEVGERIKEYLGEKEEIIIEAKEKEAKLSKEITVDENDSLSTDGSNTSVELKKKTKKEELGTKEEMRSALRGTFGKQIEGKKLRGLVNNKSLENILQSGINIKEFYDKIFAIAFKKNLSTKTDKNGKEIKIFKFGPFNGQLEDEFEKIGYDAKGGFGGEEMGALFQIIENILNTQKIISTNLDFEEKKKILFDYNVDGVLDNNVHFYTRELEIINKIKTEQEFDNLLQNLGYAGGVNDFDTQFSTNYYVTREEFKTRLGDLLSVNPPLNPAEMLNNPNSVREYTQLMAEINNHVGEAIDQNEKLNMLSQEDKELIKLQAVGVIVGSSIGAGVSFDIRKLTNDLIDSAYIGIVDGVPGFGLSRNIIDLGDGTFKIDVGVMNLVPFVSSSIVLEEGKLEEFKTLFPTEIDASTRVVLGGAYSKVASTVLLNTFRKDEATKEGINEAKEQMSEMLDRVFENIKNGKSFEDSDFKSDKKNEVVYNRLKDYVSNGGMSVELIKEGTIKNYERVLYENSDGLNFKGVGVGLVFVTGYLPIPLILINGENHDTEWNEVKSVSVKQLKVILGKKQENLENSDNKDSEIVESSLEKFNDMYLSQFERGFSFKTRYNKGALDFIDPKNDLDTRWNGLKRLASSAKALRVTVGLPDFLATVDENDIERKWIIISTLSQYAKKANDYDNGNIETWNTTTEDFINTDIDRRSGFDTLFGISMQNEADEYYEKLLAGKGKIGKTELMGVGLDAVATKNVENENLKGVDINYTNLKILTIDNKPILIPINKDKEDKIINTLEGLNFYGGNTEKDQLIKGIEAGYIKLYYYKDPDGFDDRILFVEEGSNIEDIGSIQVYHPSFKSYDAYTGVTMRTEKEKTDGKGGGDGQSSTPGYTEEGGVGTGGGSGTPTGGGSGRN